MRPGKRIRGYWRPGYSVATVPPLFVIFGELNPQCPAYCCVRILRSKVDWNCACLPSNRNI